MTGEDVTGYFFDIKNEKFGEALDIFSAFFKDPLFSESSVDREMNAVDSEFKGNLSSEARRVY
jgi:insulysin